MATMEGTELQKNHVKDGEMRLNRIYI